MARDLRHLPWRELGVDILGQLLAFLGQAVYLFGDVDGRIVLHETQFLDLGIEFGDRLFKVQESCFAHSSSVLFSARGQPWLVPAGLKFSLFYRNRVQTTP